MVRTSLIPGLLKTIRENRSHPLPIKIFETSEVVFKDASRERQARNVRHAAAIWSNKTAGFEVVHGMLDRAMKMLEVPRIGSEDNKAETGYYIKESSGECIDHSGCRRLIVCHRSGFLPWPCCYDLLPGCPTEQQYVVDQQPRRPCCASSEERYTNRCLGDLASKRVSKVRDWIPLFCS